MRKIMSYATIVLLFTILIMFFLILSNPLRKEPEKIRESILEITPVGTSRDDVLKIIADKEQWIKYEHYNYGYLLREGFPELYYQTFKNIDRSEIVGEETIVASIGKYQDFFKVTVFVYWAFDKDAKLIDVAVKKEGDGF